MLITAIAVAKGTRAVISISFILRRQVDQQLFEALAATKCVKVLFHFQSGQVLVARGDCLGTTSTANQSGQRRRVAANLIELHRRKEAIPVIDECLLRAAL
jgi:hypothetical protein